MIDFLPIPDGSYNKAPWRICIDRPFYNCEKIFPIQQRKVRELIDDCAKDPAVQKVVIFGSSVRSDCHPGSDVDCYVIMAENRRPNLSAKDFPIDLWTNDTIDPSMLERVKEEGVTVYEQRR